MAKDRERYAFNYYTSRGLAPHQAAGFVGNLIQESGLNTGARNPGDGRDGSDSIGIMQANGQRARNLRAFAQATGRDVGNLDAQLDFTLHELGLGDKSLANLPGWATESKAGRALASAPDVAAATAAGISYERPAGWSANNPTGGHGWGNRYGHASRLAGLPPGENIAATGSGDAMAIGNAGSDTLSTSYGGLGGLGGMQPEAPKVFGWRDAANAVADSLMTAPADEWWADTGKHLAAAELRDERRAERREVLDQRQADRQALQLALRSQGFNAEEAAAYAASPQAARVAAAGKEAQQARAQENQTLAWLRREHPDLADEVQAGLPITEGLRIASGRRNATGESAEVAERRNIAIANGIDPNSEEGQRYILTGNLPAGDKGVTAGDRQAIREADDLARDGESVYSLLDEALKLSPDAYEGPLAGAKTWAGSNLPDWLVPDGFADPKTAENTRNYDNIITTQALGSLKQIFGGAPTEGERAILLEVQGMSSQPKSVREGIIRRAKDAVKRRVEFNRDRASELRGGTYYRPREAAAPVPAAAPAPIAPGSDADPLGLRR